jgi:hypothetical protein
MTLRGATALLALLLASGHAGARPETDPTPLHYADAAEETRFHALTATLRCVQCQNQSLADSDAQIAHDLRREVLALMRQGRSDAQIRSSGGPLRRIRALPPAHGAGHVAAVVRPGGPAAGGRRRHCAASAPPRQDARVPLPGDDQEW